MDDKDEIERHINSVEINKCTICFNMYTNENICITDCNHEYCNDCISNWINRGRVDCPMCRQEIKNYRKGNIINHIIKLPGQYLVNNRNINQNITRNNTMISRRKLCLMKYCLVVNLLYSTYLQYVNYNNYVYYKNNNCSFFL